MNLIFAKVSEQYVYHLTSYLGLQSILAMNKIGIPTDYDSSKGYQSIKKGWISFSRSKLYNSAPGSYSTGAEVRFVFEYQKLKRIYKNKPYADPFVTKSNDWDDLVKSYESRWESEEQFYGPISLNYGLKEIQILKSVFNKKLDVINRMEISIQEIKQEITYLRKGMFWNKIKEDWMTIETDKQRKIHNEEAYQQKMENYKRMINEIKEVFNHPKVVIVSSFK